MRNKAIICFVSLMTYACHQKKECIIKEIDSIVLNGVGMYEIYANDTCWDQMVSFADSLTIVNKDTSLGGLYIFVYPEDTGKIFKPNSFALTKNAKALKIMEVFDSSLTEPPYHIKKFPDNYKEALREEVKKQRNGN